jgi:hypothetical protein
MSNQVARLVEQQKNITDALIIQQRRDGRTLKEISIFVKLSSAYVHGVCARAGLTGQRCKSIAMKTKQATARSAKADKALEMCRRGLTLAEIAPLIGCKTRNGPYHLLHKYHPGAVYSHRNDNPELRT